jgi:glycosyltransferase involved in cell wall biosynthesis
VAGYLRQHYKINTNRIRTIPRGIAMDKFHPTTVTPVRMIDLSQQWRIPEGASVVLLPARLTRWKGHHVLIDAIARLRRADVFCLIIGDDQGRQAYRKELEDKIEAHNLGGCTRIVDHCMDMPAAYMLATVVCVPSLEPEGFGRVAVEAQAMGRAVIATDHGAARETIRRGETGWLVPPGDVEALAASIGEALQLTPSQRAVLATRAMAHVAQNFTREAMCDQTLDVYAELLGKSGSIGNHHVKDQIYSHSGPEDANLRAAE